MTFQKRIEQEGNQFCVYSYETGRNFGCYKNREQAETRLNQIERFGKNLTDMPNDQLVHLHKGCHKATTSKELVTVHDLIEDELESRGFSPPYSTGDLEQKLAAVSLTVPVIKEEDRFTLAPVYVPGLEDSDGETISANDLQKSLWDWVQKGDRTIYLQHSNKPAGEMVELLTWPFEIETSLDVPNQGVTKYRFPKDTPFMGVIWDNWAWDMVKGGELRGYSIGGRAKRLEVELPEMQVA
jgi:hypothetical protein